MIEDQTLHRDKETLIHTEKEVRVLRQLSRMKQSLNTLNNKIDRLIFPLIIRSTLMMKMKSK